MAGAAGKLWQQDVKRQQKERGEVAGGGGKGKQSAYLRFTQAELPAMRALHPLIDHRTAFQRVAQLWRVRRSPGRGAEAQACVCGRSCFCLGSASACGVCVCVESVCAAR
eukprot:2051685-Rhodomonas_salina.1